MFYEADVMNPENVIMNPVSNNHNKTNFLFCYCPWFSSSTVVILYKVCPVLLSTGET